MPSEEELEIRLTYLEDQLNRVNLVVAHQGRQLEQMSDGLSRMGERLKSMEEHFRFSGSSPESASFDGSEPGGPSDAPPDGSNR